MNAPFLSRAAMDNRALCGNTSAANAPSNVAHHKSQGPSEMSLRRRAGWSDGAAGQRV